MLKRFFNKITTPFDEIIIQADDPDDVRLGKRLFIRFSIFLVSVSLFTVFQGLVLGEQETAIFGFLVSIPFFLNLVFLRRTRRFRVHFYIFALLNMLIPFYASAAFGGFNINSPNLMASFLSLLLVVLIFYRREIIGWFLVYATLVILSGFLEPIFNVPENILPSITFDNIFTTLLVVIIILLTLNYYKREKNSALDLLAQEQEKSENLLLNILPKQIVDTLKVEEQVIANKYEEASILFADLVGFTPMTAQMKPTEVVKFLNQIYSHFDTLEEKYGVEKIRTIGDSYMVASGVPEPRQDHAEALAMMALDMAAYIRVFPSQNGATVDVRIGINSGPIVAGVIGQKKFHYDVWGDTVNTASRMESHSVAGKIQVTRSTYELLKDEFLFDSRGEIDVKGKGQMETWFLIGRRK